MSSFNLGIKDKGCEYIALFIFSKTGTLVRSKIHSFGPRDQVDEKAYSKKYESLLSSLGEVKFCRIEVEPFVVIKNDKKFGLIPHEPEDEEDVWAVELLPGNFMAFFEPWDSGEYDT